MTDCVFCKIVSGEIPSKRVYEDDQVIVINDLNPGAPVHVLVIPKEHTENILTASPEILVHVKKVLPEIVKKLGIAEKRIPRCGEHRRGRGTDRAPSAFPHFRRKRTGLAALLRKQQIFC